MFRSPIASHLFSRFLDLKLRKHIVNLDLLDKDRIYKWKGALTKVEITKDRVDHKPHLSLHSLSHTSWTFIFNFRNDDLPRILGNRALFGQNIISFKGARQQRPVILKRTEPHRIGGNPELSRETTKADRQIRRPFWVSHFIWFCCI